MTDPAKDFRYTIGDVTVEAYQITESSRFAQKLWPEWLDSRSFLTIDGAAWFVLDGKEVEIPALAWIVRQPSGQLSFVDALDFENYAKVVPHVLEVFDDASAAAVPAAPVDDDLLAEVREAFEMLQMGEDESALKRLRDSRAARAGWCECAPGLCDKQDKWGCRQHSPPRWPIGPVLSCQQSARGQRENATSGRRRPRPAAI